MKTNHFIIFAAVLLICCAMLGCGKDKMTTVYGTVFYKNGNPASNVMVSLKINYAGSVVCSAVTGADGQYEIIFDYEGGPYYLDVTYNVNHHFDTYSRTINIKKGEIKQIDVILPRSN